MTKISNLYSLTNYITANTSGNIVISAPSSGYALDVTGTGRFTGAVTAANFYVPSSNEIRLYNTNSTNWGTIKGSTDSTNGYITLTGGSGNGMTIANSGNVGIGTTGSPWYLFTALDIGTNAALANYTDYAVLASNIYYASSSNWTFKTAGYGSALYMRKDDGNIYFSTFGTGSAGATATGTERMRINSIGNLMLGGTTSDTNLYRFYLKSATSDATSYVITAYNSSSNGMFYVRSTGDIYFPAYANGTLSTSSGQVVSSSDINLKIDDGGIEEGLEKVMKLNPRYFYWKEDSGIDDTDRHLGFYAQEIQKALGNEVANCNSENKWGIYDRGIIAMLTKAIQELSAKVTALENK